MATVWAKSNGNWTDTTLWAFWNENTQQIEDYGQVPQEDDVVYCNGYNITISVMLEITCDTITNDICEYTQRYGGSILISVADAIVFNANMINAHEGSTRLIANSGNIILTIYINGDVESLNGDPLIYTSHKNIRIYVNGNVSGSLLTGEGDSNYNSKTIVINGNVKTRGFSTFKNVAMPSGGSIIISINGNCELDVPFGNYLDTTSSFNITGIVKLIGNVTLNNYGRVSGSNWVYYIDGIIDVSESTTFRLFDDDKVVLHTTSGVSVVYNADYPIESNVKKDIPYAFNQMVGTYDINQYLPPESVVLKDYEYGDSDDRKTGTMVQEVNVDVGCVTPEDVRKDAPLVGMGVVGSLVVPSVDDVREGVVFDNGSVGTLIVQGGGDRLRIADFGYYTRSTSITYIVDLTESDKPAFADCEEIVLRSLFPTLNLDNIPDKYFDDLFVQFLRYRLLVEYYRGTSINSKFTPSEPTSEIVNYANTKCEYWLNTANLFLQLWGEKYPNSVKKDRILL